jgi:transposase InsO family protein
MVTVEVLTGVQRRRRWTAEQKKAMVLETEQPGMSVSVVARKYEVHPNQLFRMTRSNRRWCSDAFEIACWSKERLRVAFSLDCCDREILSYVATTGGIDGHLIRDLMVEAMEARFASVDRLPEPIEWLSDNGPAYIARETVAFAESVGFEVCTTPFYSPESNGMAEAFVKTFKRDYVHANPLYNARFVLEQLPKWFEDYNEQAPHKALKMKSPREYRRLAATLEECPVK